jgi:hypothetical protein
MIMRLEAEAPCHDHRRKGEILCSLLAVVSVAVADYNMDWLTDLSGGCIKHSAAPGLDDRHWGESCGDMAASDGMGQEEGEA